MNNKSEKALEELAGRILHYEAKAAESVTQSTEDFVQGMKNENTTRKTKADVAHFRVWLHVRGIDTKIEKLAPAELDKHMASFFLEATKPDRSQYEPDSLTAIQGSLMRYLLENLYPFDLKTAAEFKHSRDVLASKRKLLKSEGKGNKRRKSDPFTSEEIAKLWEEKLLGAGKLYNIVMIFTIHVDLGL